MSAASVISNTRRRAVCHFISSAATNGNVTANLAYGPANIIYKVSNGSNGQSFDEANAVAGIKGLTYSLNGVAHIERLYSNTDRENVLVLGAGQGDFDLNAINYNQKANANIRVHFGTTQGFVTLTVHKEAGFNDPDTSQLQPRDRGPF